MREAAGGDGGAEALDRGVVANEVVEGGWKRHCFQLTSRLCGDASSAGPRGGTPPPPLDVFFRVKRLIKNGLDAKYPLVGLVFSL